MSADRSSVLLNCCIFLAAAAAALSLLSIASHGSVPAVIAAAIAFSFVNNTLFSLLHECVHGLFSRTRWLNDSAGVIAGCFFPTSFTCQRHFHLGHHQRNRSDVESFDVLLPDDNIWVKRIQLYCILTGLYWLSAPIACLLLLLCPWALQTRLLRSPQSAVQRMSADAMLSGIDRLDLRRIRIEIAFALSAQIGIFWGLDLSWTGWLACYGAFALNWSALQYADHAFSRRHVIEGAWNLRVTPMARWFFLNYHHHLAHHQHPDVPWKNLPAYVDHSRESPSFWRIYLRMWRGPVPVGRVEEG